MKHVDYSKIVLVCVYVCVCVLTACRPNAACRQNMKVGCVCELRAPYLDKNAQLHVETQWDSITVVGRGQAEPLYNNAKGISSLLLPMHTDGDSTVYTLLYHNQLDTLCIRHSNQQKFISMECGCVVEHDLISFSNTHHWISSIEVVTDTMRRSGQTNINIWLEMDSVIKL